MAQYRQPDTGDAVGSIVLSELAEGRRAVTELLRAGRPVEKLYVLRTARGLGDIIGMAREARAAVVPVERDVLDRMSVTGSHQGVIAAAAAFAYCGISDILARAGDEPPLVVVCDGVMDERNLGAIIRTAEAAGAHGLVLPKRRSAGLTAVTARASAGAAEHLPVARVPGIPAALRDLKNAGLWIYGAAAEGADNVFETDFSGPAALVLGGEENGLQPLTRALCDKIVALPMRGKTASLNVSCAAAVILYQMKG